LWGIIAIQQSWLPYISAGTVAYSGIHADPFDGMMMPILYIPDWSKTAYQNKTTRFSDIPISDYIPLPIYDANSLLDTTSVSKKSLIEHYTYITPYMGSYRLNYKENDGSHNAIDIRSPIGTPVLAIANGIVVRTIEADATGNRFVVIRHEGIPLAWSKQDIYSCYLHLSEITVQEGNKIRKWDMLGRVGMSGIATTPHLHIQIDTQDAPFHPYWPFTSADSRSAGLGFFDSVNAGIGRDNAMRYSLHPMKLIQMFAGGIIPSPEVDTPLNSISELQSAPQIPREQELVPVNASIESIIAGMNSSSISTAGGKAMIAGTGNKTCEKKRFSDVSATSKIGKTLYELIDTKCMFQYISKFDGSATLTQRDAIVMLMQYYNMSPTTGTSHFLDIAIGDPFQGYAIAAYRKGAIDGNYALPSKLLSREDFIELLVKIGKLEKNPSGIKLYRDTSPMNFKFQYIQDYAFKIRARGGNFYPQSLLTRQWAIELIGNILDQDTKKK
jgi:murein DD-endopeptidase MepM/ murein hydrolase activator NlpD